MKTQQPKESVKSEILNRNHRLSARDKGTDFHGEWIVVPEVDFEFARQSHQALLEAADKLGAENTALIKANRWLLDSAKMAEEISIQYAAGADIALRDALIALMVRARNAIRIAEGE